jgi:hypothetical protein
MLTGNMHLMIRLPLLLICVGILVTAIPDGLQAEPTEPAARGEKGDGESPSRGALSEIMQVGARLVGKNPRSNDPRGLPDVEAEGTSATAARKAAIAALPLEHLTPENRQRVNTLLKSVSFYRRLPKVTFTVEPDVYNYFLAHPDVAVSIWRAMKISKLKMWQTGRFEYEADTCDGSVGALEILHIGGEKNLVTCDGQYKTPMFTKPIEAKSLMFLQTTFARQPDGTVQVTHRADLFVTFPSLTIDVVAKIFSPLTVKMTDRTFTEISLFLKMMSMAMCRRPDWVEQITEKMEGVADVRKDQILELSAQVYAAAQTRELQQSKDEDSAQTESSGGSPNRGVSGRSGPSRVISAEHRDDDR